MAITKDDVRREHEAAMGRLDAPQLAALKRINEAFMRSRFANASAKEMMEEVFEAEARSRNDQGPG
jgi:Fe-S cluster assembly scaffold protein SufB